ncbi:cupin domain-containing carboxymuconolactone decarboxylase family protein [Alistipes finegoldii]|uniref:cupin domain-containing carboxymuconolactone decarboxylase family protein n=1 Tax=Alistipes finegoldii TaxID=214856 RepID=UPI00248B90E1|nr:carboxymuconolactone decarboxylase family protein [Alistipes finegoldii]
MKQLLLIIAAALLAAGTCNRINARNMEKPKKISAFPVGDKLPETFSKYFVGQAYLARLTRNGALNCPISNVTFEPGCRNNWHSHTGGQILVAVGGRGYYQAEGEPARELLPGDVVEIAPDAVHWHGAAPDSWFSHLAIETNPQTNRNTWLGPVDDAHYSAVTAVTAGTAATAGTASTPASATASAAGIAATAESSAAAVSAAMSMSSAAPIPAAMSMSATAPLSSAKSAASRLRAAAVETRAQLFSGCESELAATDPELIEIFDNFAFAEVLGYGDLDVKTRMMCILASCIAGAAQTEFRTMLEGALNVGVTPVEAKEVVYQAVPYVGMARTVDFVHIVNGVLTARGVALPLEGQSATSPETRFEKGLAVQKAIFGERIDAMRAAAPENQKHMQDYLSANCFGDYVSRGGLDAKVRELLTFSMLLTLGGCESQLRSHIQGNLNVGNDKRTLLSVVTQLLPYAGYPRTLNAIACLNEAIPENE